MTDEVEMLLEGPRGRRLCLEVAMGLDERVYQEAFRLGFDRDQSPGSFRFVLEEPDTAAMERPGMPTRYQQISATTEMGDVEGDGRAVPGRCPNPVASSEGATPGPDQDDAHSSSRANVTDPDDVGTLAGLLETVDARQTTDGLLMHALRASVDSAQYWQAPDGHDILAADPALRPGLRRIAHQVLASPHSRWWRRSAPPQQWTVQKLFDGEHATSPSFSPADAITNWVRDTKARDAEDARRRDPDPAANISGEWWSISYGPLQSTGILPTGEPAALDLVEDAMGARFALVTPVAASGRILEIHSAAQWVELCRQFPLDVSASRRHDWYRVTGRDGTWVIPDWERVAARWDGVHLSVIGYLNGATRALDVAPGVASMIAGGSPDMTLWLTDVVEVLATEKRVQWERPGPEAQWRRVPAQHETA